MPASTGRPLILPLSNPTSRMEAMPDDVLAWSDGKALVATGTPVGPVEHNGTSYSIGQANNALVFPGLGLGVIVAGAKRVTKRMLDAAAKALGRQVHPATPGAALLPDVKNLRAISAVVVGGCFALRARGGGGDQTPHNVGG